MCMLLEMCAQPVGNTLFFGSKYVVYIPLLCVCACVSACVCVCVCADETLDSGEADGCVCC